MKESTATTGVEGEGVNRENNRTEPGDNVASVEIEAALLAHPAVDSAAVIGLPHPLWGEVASGFVKLKDGVVATEAEIADHCRQLIAGFQTLKLIRIVAHLPTTATGKLRRAELRQQFIDHFAGDGA